MGSFLAFFIFGETFDQGERSLFVRSIDGEVIIAQFCLENYASEMLLLVILADRKLIITDIMSFEG